MDLSDKKLLLKNIPEDMKRYHNWCVYKLLYDRKSGRTTKKPINPKSFKGASSTDPDTWVSYDEAEKCFLERKADGLGFMFGYTPFVGVDIDHCVKSGGMSEEASDIIKRLDSYTEYSPSRTGVHIICKAHEGFKLNGSKNTKKGIEIYSEARFFTMTGDMLPGYGCLRECEGALTGVHAEYIKGNTSPDKGEEATAINSDNETITADIKYKEPVNIKFYGKMIFSANTVPRFSDKSNGLKRRINILPFTNDFTKNGKRDFNILAELRSEAVAEYCIYKAVTHLKKLLSTGSFTKTKAVINANKEYAKRNNPVLEFLEDLENGDIKNDVDITAGTDITVIPANKVFEYYKNWCFHSNYKAVGRNEFYRLVQLEGYDKKRVKKEGEREYYFYPLQ